MQGITIPDPNKLQILIEWLNMDINKIFTAEEKPTEIPQNFENEFYAMLEQAVQEVRLFSQKTMVKTLIRMMQDNANKSTKYSPNISDTENIYIKINEIQLFDQRIFDYFNNKETVYELLLLFSQDTLEICNSINQEILNRDFVTVEFLLGRLLGSTGMIGANRLNMATHLFRTLILQMAYDKSSHHQFDKTLHETIAYINKFISKSKTHT